MIESSFRELRPNERRLFAVLLDAPFEGRDELIAQLAWAQARTIDEEGSIAFSVSSRALARTSERVVAEASYADQDGVRVRLLFHVVDGKAHELEIFKDDGSPIQRGPDPESIQVGQLGH